MGKKVVRAISLGIIVLFVLVSLSPGQSMIFRNEPASTLRTQIYYPTDDRSTGNGNVEYMEVRNGSSQGHNFEWVALVKFNISSIPSNAKIISATLNLYYWQWRDNDPADRPLNLYKAITDWNEETLEWYNQPNYDTQSTGNSSVPETPGLWMEWDVTKDIQSFVNGTINNYGWKIGDENYWPDGDIPVISFRTKEYGNYIPYLKVLINLPPDAPLITGPAKGKVGTPYIYNFTAIDPEGNEMYYFIDWGDGTNSSWIGPYSSGIEIPKSHTWSKKGTYTIIAKAKDIYGNEGDWGALSLTMPYSYDIPLIQFWEKLLERFPNAFPILRHLLGY